MVLGVDEAGRGSWAGPLVAGAVILRVPIVGLNDSKLLTKHQREQLYDEIMNKAAAVGVGWVDSKELDRLGLTQAVRTAMTRAVAAIQHSYHEVIVDGPYNFLSDITDSQAIIRADQTVPAVSAASIVAKVSRDRFMTRQDITFPNYGFAKHVGYGTAYHQAALKLHGVCKLHRRSFKPIQAFIT